MWHADVDPSSISSQAADIEFSAGSLPVTLTITPENNLVAGNFPSNAKMATFKVTPANATATIAFRWTPGGGVPAYTSYTGSGQSDSNNKIYLHFDTDNIVPGEDVSWLVAKSAGAFDDLIETSRSQTINAGAYILSVDAGILTD